MLYRHSFPCQMELNFYIEDSKQSFVARTDKTQYGYLLPEAHCPCTMEVLLDKMKKRGAVPEGLDLQSNLNSFQCWKSQVCVCQ